MPLMTLPHYGRASSSWYLSSNLYIAPLTVSRGKACKYLVALLGETKVGYVYEALRSCGSYSHSRTRRLFWSSQPLQWVEFRRARCWNSDYETNLKTVVYGIRAALCNNLFPIPKSSLRSFGDNAQHMIDCMRSQWVLLEFQYVVLLSSKSHRNTIK